MTKPRTQTRYEITVWNMGEGDVVSRFRDANEACLRHLEDFYGDEPLYEIVIDREWEEDISG